MAKTLVKTVTKTKSNRSSQLVLNAEDFGKISDVFGGSLLKNSNAKSNRPLDSRYPIHLVLKSRRSVLNLPLTKAKVESTLVKTCRKYGVKLYKWANVGNHIHAIILIPHILRWPAFVRELTGKIALSVASASPALKKLVRDQGLWLYRPFTRIVRSWKKAFSTLKRYVELNEWEALGFISRKDIKTLKDLERMIGPPAFG